MANGSERRCFESDAFQLLHKYSYYLFILFLGGVCWWLKDLNERVRRSDEIVQALSRELSALRVSDEQLLRRIEGIDRLIMRLEGRIYDFPRRRTEKEWAPGANPEW